MFSISNSSKIFKICLVLYLLSPETCDCTGYRSSPSLGYGYSGTAGAYPAVRYPSLIQPPSTGYVEQNQAHIPGYKLNSDTGYVIQNGPQHVPNTYGGDDSSGIVPPPSYNGNQRNIYGGHVNDGGYNNANRPDLSDPCFSKYPNCMIVNAQPYERRSSTTTQDCKSICLNSTVIITTYSSGPAYQCRSFVYDVHNHICDLYSHLGNVHPSQLIQYYGRDYYEPNGYGGSCASTATAFPPSTQTPVVPSQFTCPSNQEARFVKTVGSHYSNTGPSVTVESVTEDQCIDICTKNQALDGKQALCKSFNYNSATRQCQIFQSAASSTTTQQNLPSDRPNTNYFEKICLDSNAVRNCPRILERLPQKVLVGFAEVVTGATSTSDCLQKCSNSQQLFNFICASGMYYSDQGSSDTSCILNIETRRTHPELFTDDTTDIVDYFELNCGNVPSTRQALVRNFIQRNAASRQLSSLGTNFSDNKLESIDVDNSREASFNEWTQWTPCDRNSDGRRVRYRRCSKPNIKECPLESERCRRETLQSSSRFAIQKDIDEAPINDSREAMCGLDVCCPTLGGCRIGLVKSSNDGKLRWCSDPCKNEKLKEI